LSPEKLTENVVMTRGHRFGWYDCSEEYWDM